MAAPPPPYYAPPPNASYGFQPPPPNPGYGFQPPPPNAGYGGQQPPYGYPEPGANKNAGAGGSYPNPPTYPDQGGSRSNDVEANVGFVAKDFSDKSVRAAFVRKVYFTLSIQLGVTLGVVALFVFCKPVKEFIRDNFFLYYFGYAIFLVTYFMLVCCKNVRRKFPQNVIMLSVFTLALSYMVGVISSFYDTDVIFMALGITVAITVGVSIFACQTKFDFTKWIGVLFVISLGFFVFGIFTIFFYSNILNLIYSAIGAILFTVFLAVDTQLIIGGKRHEISPEDHILGSIMLYIDIVYIFLFILSLLQGSK